MASIHRKVSEIIDAVYSETLMSDSLLSDTKRWHIQRMARKGLKEFMEKSKTSEVRGLLLSVDDNNSVDLPTDYIKYVRVSEMTDCGKLVPIAVDASIVTANSYLLDHQDKILLDHNGIALLGSIDSEIDRFCDFDYTNCGWFNDNNYYTHRFDNYRHYEEYYSINYSYDRGVTFTQDSFNNRLQFSGKDLDEVVVEYVSDPMKNVGHVDDLEIKVQFADALEKYIYKEIIARKKNIPMNEKERARRDYREAMLDAKISANLFSLTDLASVTNLK